MIIDKTIALITSFLQWVFGSLPTTSLSGLVGDASGFAASLGDKMAPWNAYLPLAELASMLGMLVTIWIPAMLLYVAANWIWRHIPDILGIGPGAG